MMRKTFMLAMVLAAMAVSFQTSAEDEASSDKLNSEADVLNYLNQAMPRTSWTKAQKLEAYPGYYAVKSEDRGDRGAMYFDVDKKILVIGLLINLDLNSEAAQKQEIAPGSSN